jgi:vitamin B12 transporter
VDVTYFHNRIDDLIDFTPANIGEATTEGIEVETTGRLFSERIEWRGAYTWLEATDEDTGQRLVRRARHVAAFDVRGKPSEGSLIGAGGSYVSGAIDNDFSGFPAVRRELDDYCLLRIYGRYELNEGIAIHGRIENLLDQDYEEIAGFPGRRMGVFGGVTVSW